MVRRLGVACLFIAFMVSQGVFAQGSTSWVTADDGLEYHCPTLALLISQIETSEVVGDGFRDLVLVHTPDGTLTAEQYIGSAVVELLAAGQTQFDLQQILAVPVAVCNGNATTPSTTTSPNTQTTGDTFVLVATSNANLRSCAGTNCDVVGQVAAGDSLTAVGEENDWYQVTTNSGTAYIASFLVTRGPDNVISIDEPYFDEITGCGIAFDLARGDMEIYFILTGEQQNEIVADLYRPNETVALPVAGQLDKTFIDTGDTYIHQYYGWNIGYPAGIYTMEISLGDDTSRLAWEMGERATYKIYVMCD